MYYLRCNISNSKTVLLFIYLFICFANCKDNQVFQYSSMNYSALQLQKKRNWHRWIHWPRSIKSLHSNFTLCHHHIRTQNTVEGMEAGLGRKGQNAGRV